MHGPATKRARLAFAPVLSLWREASMVGELWGEANMHSVKSASVFAGVLLAGTSLATGAALAANPVNWTGFYVGAQAGYSNLNSVETFGDSPTSAYTLGGNGASVGVFGGYDFQVGSMFVLGVDGEVNWENAATQDDTKLSASRKTSRPGARRSAPSSGSSSAHRCCCLRPRATQKPASI